MKESKELAAQKEVVSVLSDICGDDHEMALNVAASVLASVMYGTGCKNIRGTGFDFRMDLEEASTTFVDASDQPETMH